MCFSHEGFLGGKSENVTSFSVSSSLFLISTLCPHGKKKNLETVIKPLFAKEPDQENPNIVTSLSPINTLLTSVCKNPADVNYKVETNAYLRYIQQYESLPLHYYLHMTSIIIHTQTCI
ncbi:hypothetical protein L6452_34754 [Arctium lappa]|uniref:Uncharacterized protein n=1 Tax=Arctium lappa TaxID=4217 RepID=A0ACB8YJ59_ARCLA|nr:hypothetical protein L6452_34754 [Arctium lappa]